MTAYPYVLVVDAASLNISAAATSFAPVTEQNVSGANG